MEILSRKNNTYEMYQEIFDTIPFAALISNENMEVLNVNKKFLLDSGISKKSIIGKCWKNFMPKETFNLAKKYHKERRTKNKRPPSEYEVIIYNKARELRNVIVRVKLIPKTKNSIITFEDVTKNRITQKSLNRKIKLETTISKISSRFVGNYNLNKQITNTLRDIGNLLEADHGLYFKFNENHTIINKTNQWNKKGSQPIKEKQIDIKTKFYQEFLEKLMNDEVIIINDTTKLPKDVEPFLLKLTEVKFINIFPIKDKNKLIGFILFFSNNKKQKISPEEIHLLKITSNILGTAIEGKNSQEILKKERTELKKKTIELKKLVSEQNKSRKALINILKDMEDANEQLKSLDKMKNGLVRDVSHELKTPITAIQMSTELFGYELSKIGYDNERLKDIFSMFKINTKRLKDTIDEILDINVINHGKISFDLKEEDLIKLISEVITQIKPIARKKNISIILDPKINPKITIDKNKIKRVLINLLDNAIKFSKKGNIIIKTEKKDNYVITKIKDNGKGINPNYLRDIFKRFYQIESSSVGPGLGLAISKTIIEGHNGKIWAESNGLQSGSTFLFKLPLGVKK